MEVITKSDVFYCPTVFISFFTPFVYSFCLNVCFFICMLLTVVFCSVDDPYLILILS